MPGSPKPATVEEWDERLHDIVPDSQQVANTGAKVSSRLDHRFPEPLIDGASDSGYSSRTAATVNSTQSGPSGGKSPPTVLKQVAPKHTDITRKSSRRERKDKERARPDETMQMGAYPGPGYIQPRASRSPSKPRRRDSYLRQADVYYEGNHTQYHPSTPVEPRAMEFPPQQPYYGRPPMPDYIPQQPIGYPMEEYHTSRSGRPHSAYGLYHQDRAVGWPAAAPSRGYGQPPPPPPQQYHHYEHGPPPVSSAWHQGSYSSSPYGAQHNFPPSEYYPQDHMYQRERSESREPSRRRNSMYGIPPPPPTEPEVFLDFEDDAEQYYARQPRDKPRGRGTIKPSSDYFDEDTAKMPPPALPAPRSRHAPQVHQAKRPEARKVHSAAAAVPSQRRSSKPMDLSDMREALPELDYPTRRVSREVAMPERSQSQSLRGSRRSNSYHENSRGARIAVENSGRRRPESFYYVDERPESPAAMEDRVGEAERYQAVTAGRSTAQVPLSQETLMSKVGNGLGSDNGSQKSRSNSSRGSATKTEKEAQNMTLNMNGMTIAFAEESLAGKSISIRTGDAGAMQFNITDGTTRRPKAYVQGSSYSDNTHTGGSGRRVLEDGRRAARERDDRRSERSVHQSTGHRSSRSNYSRRYQI
ncbi:uncharacterized protein N7484_009096 [Penicillium longicatenatum]|uniref:uncharacterized protein n=1 Tax=Penicillium longicatenatum TaxID=1561947 RepID=UPI002546F533|nr:uncharacterized protein N7484_009096 [Penicillium longicatenatum]KAJ5635783.1 hypothetical protein N7484_009096 [Penicillium longicatenatum]